MKHLTVYNLEMLPQAENANEKKNKSRCIYSKFFSMSVWQQSAAIRTGLASLVHCSLREELNTERGPLWERGATLTFGFCVRHNTVLPHLGNQLSGNIIRAVGL